MDKPQNLENIEKNLNALCLELAIQGGELKISPIPSGGLSFYSFGEVKRPETIDYKTNRAERDGLFCERIFGPERDYECSCGKFIGSRHKGMICDRCGVKITLSKVRKKREGHINLASPVVHFYFQQHLADSLGFDLERLQRIIYSREDDSKGGTGAEALRKILKEQKKPDWMILDRILVLPPDLRPLVELDGGRIATFYLNDLYRRVINRNNRLKVLTDLDAPRVVIGNEQRMLQQSVDQLFDNSHTRKPVLDFESGEPQKSLTDFLINKLENFWRKSCEYCGEAVALYDSGLNVQECGLPSRVLLELYQPLVVRKLREDGSADTILKAKKIIEGNLDLAKPALEYAISTRPLLIINSRRAIALYPKIKEQDAIFLHPDTYKKLGLGMKGEKISYHLPLSEKAVEEARQFVGKVVEGDGKVESGFSSLVKDGWIQPIIDLAVSGKTIQLSPLEQSLYRNSKD